MTTMAQRAVVLGSLAFLFTFQSPIFAQTFTHAMPSSVTPGKTSLVTCFGKGLADARHLWLTFPATVELVPGTNPSDTQAVFKVTVPDSTPIGLSGCRVVTETGISDMRLFVVDDLPVATEAASHNSIEQAQKLTLPTAVDGVVLAEQGDFYGVTVTAGQRVAFEVVGDRLGTGLDPLIIVYSKDGKQLINHDNDEGLGFDLRFEYVFKDAGEYFVEVRDTRFQGGGNWAYHLRMGDFPIARVAYPAGGKRGDWVSIAFPGRKATDVPPRNAQVSTNPLDDMLTISARGANASTWVPFVVDEKDQQLELEPNDDVANANGFEVGRTLNGRFQVPKDVDAFGFTAKKGETISFVADARRFSSPADLYVRVLNDKGNQVAVVDDSGTAEGRLNFKVPADGSYSLIVEDLHRRGGPEFAYRIETGSASKGFALQPSVDRIVVARGSEVPLMLTASRTGYSGPIGVRLDGDTPELGCGDAQVPNGAGKASMTVRASMNAPLGTHTIRLVGTGKVGNDKLVGGIDLVSLLAPKLSNLQMMPPSVVRDIPVLVTPRPFFTLAARLDAPAVARYGKTPVTIIAEKEKFFDADITLAVENLPANVALAAKPIPKGKRAIQLEFESKAKTPLGRFPVFISGTASHHGRSTSVYADVLFIDIQPAFSLTVEPKEVTIVRGAKVKLTVKASRLPAYAGPIDLTLKSLPKGIAVAAAKIADKQNEVVIELTAAKDAPAATVNKVIATGTAKIGGQAETVNAAAIKLVVKEK